MSMAFVLILVAVPSALFVLGLVISKVSESLMNKSSPFECGFEEFSSARLSFSLKFFLVVLVFLIFDVEIALVLPIPFSYGTDLYYWGLSVKLLLGILLVGLYLEMNQGSLSWVE